MFCCVLVIGRRQPEEETVRVLIRIGFGRTALVKLNVHRFGSSDKAEERSLISVGTLCGYEVSDPQYVSRHRR